MKMFKLGFTSTVYGCKAYLERTLHMGVVFCIVETCMLCPLPKKEERWKKIEE
jgi:hypothetical protein